MSAVYDMVLPLLPAMLAAFLAGLILRLVLEAYLRLPIRWQCVGERWVRLRPVALVGLKPRRLRWVARFYGKLWALTMQQPVDLLPRAQAAAQLATYQNWMGCNRVEGWK